MHRKGLLVIICGPSGVGKGTVLAELKRRDNPFVYSVSATTRKPRKDEVDGVNYFFKSKQEFEKMIENDELIEWVDYCGNYYGTPKKFIDEKIALGNDVILEIEVKGALKIKNKFKDSVAIFIMPPKFDDLRRRIEGRGTETEEVIKKRLQKAVDEVKMVSNFDYIVINDEVEKASKHIEAILKSEKLLVRRNPEILKYIGLNS